MFGANRKRSTDSSGGYYERVERLLSQRSYLRRGQAYMIVLGEINPELYNKISGTKYDPFYRDDRIDDFLSKIHRSVGIDRDDDEEITINLNLSWPFL